MQVQYRLKLGQDEFVLNFDVKDEKDFFEQVSFYSNLPKTAPNGSDDLKLVFRTTKKGHKYYSLISEKERKEFKLGQNLEANGGGLFPKGWEDAYQADADDAPQQNSAPVIGAQQAPAQRAAPPVQQQAPVIGAPAPSPALPNPNFPGMVNPIIGPSAAATPPITPSPAAPQPAAAPAAPSPQVAAVANNVLARFGIQK